MNEARTGQATFTLEEALAALRESALREPGTWKVAESERASLELAWLAGATGIDTPEALRVTRRFVPPVSEDLERVAAGLPAGLEIGPIIPEAEARRFTLGLRPRTDRPGAERCARCGASPRFGTRVYGDGQLCAVCALWGEASGPEHTADVDSSPS
jgi:hypothetical protein